MVLKTEPRSLVIRSLIRAVSRGFCGHCSGFVCERRSKSRARSPEYSFQLSDSDFVDCGAWAVPECNVGMSPDKPPAPEHCGLNSSASKRLLISGCVYLRYHVAPEPIAHGVQFFLNQRSEFRELERHALHRAGPELVKVDH